MKCKEGKLFGLIPYGVTRGTSVEFAERDVKRAERQLARARAGERTRPEGGVFDISLSPFAFGIGLGLLIYGGRQFYLNVRQAYQEGRRDREGRRT